MAGRIRNRTFRLLAGISVVAYLFALPMAGGRAVLYVLAAYPLLGALLWTYARTNDPMALGTLALGALLPPILTIVVLALPTRMIERPDGDGMAWFLAFAWSLVSVVQVFALCVAGWAMQSLEHRIAHR